MNAYLTDLAEPEWSQLKELVTELDTLIGSGEAVRLERFATSSAFQNDDGPSRYS